MKMLLRLICPLSFRPRCATLIDFPFYCHFGKLVLELSIIYQKHCKMKMYCLRGEISASTKYFEKGIFNFGVRNYMHAHWHTEIPPFFSKQKQDWSVMCCRQERSFTFNDEILEHICLNINFVCFYAIASQKVRVCFIHQLCCSTLENQYTLEIPFCVSLHSHQRKMMVFHQNTFEMFLLRSPN